MAWLFPDRLRYRAVMYGALPVLLLLAGVFACIFVLMWSAERLMRSRQPAGQTQLWPPVLRRTTSPLGPDDDLAFLRELRRRIDLGHFRH